MGAGGTILLSTNSGETWSASSPTPGTNLNAVAWDATDGLFVAAGDFGVILTSPDGNFWAVGSAGSSQNFHSITFANSGNLAGVGVLVADRGTVFPAGTPPPQPINPVDGTNCAYSPISTPVLQVTSSTNLHYPPGTVTVDWYDVPTGGVAVATSTNSYVPPNTVPGPDGLATNYNYWAEERDLRTGFAYDNAEAAIEWHGNYVLQQCTNLAPAYWMYVTQGVGGILNAQSVPVLPSPPNNSFRLYASTN